MCSNTSNSGGGGGGGGGIGGGGHCDSYLKKPKRTKVPRRGPGVAELEKILRDQESFHDLERFKIEGFSSCMVSPSSYFPRPSFISSSKSLPVNVPFDLDHTGFSPPSPLSKTSLYGNGSSRNGNTQLGGGSIGFPEQPLLPRVRGSCESSNNGKGPKLASGFPFPLQSMNGSNQKIPSPPPLPRKHCQYSSPMINHFPQSVMPSSSTPSSAGLHHHVEPPSNQRSCQKYTSLWPEEEKMVGTKRPLPLSMDNTPVPQFHCKVPPFYPNTYKPDRSPSCNNHVPLNLEPSKTLSRDAMPGGPLELNSKKCISDYGAPNGNFLIFGSSTTSLPLNQTPQREVYNFNSIYSHDTMEDTYKRPGPGGLVDKKTFYSFLLSQEQLGRAETTLSLSNERNEPIGDGIDLSLKL